LGYDKDMLGEQTVTVTMKKQSAAFLLKKSLANSQQSRLYSRMSFCISVSAGVDPLIFFSFSING
jgi:hypothetical protein